MKTIWLFIFWINPQGQPEPATNTMQIQEQTTVIEQRELCNSIALDWIRNHDRPEESIGVGYTCDFGVKEQN